MSSKKDTSTDLILSSQKAKLDPSVKPISFKKQVVLDEDTYIDTLDHIVKRDFFFEIKQG